MATYALTTRRALFGAAAGLPAIIATPIFAKEIGKGEAWRLKKRDFIQQIALMHPNGRASAMRAMAMDLDPDDCACIQLVWHGHPEWEPALHFEAVGRPNVQIVVGPSYAYEHGRVL